MTLSTDEGVAALAPGLTLQQQQQQAMQYGRIIKGKPVGTASAAAAAATSAAADDDNYELLAFHHIVQNIERQQRRQQLQQYDAQVERATADAGGGRLEVRGTSTALVPVTASAAATATGTATAATTTTGPAAGGRTGGISMPDLPLYATLGTYPSPADIVLAHRRYAVVTTVAGPPAPMAAFRYPVGDGGAVVGDGRLWGSSSPPRGGEVLPQPPLHTVRKPPTDVRYRDGFYTAARMRAPRGLCVVPGSGGVVVVSDCGNQFLRALVPRRAVTRPSPSLAHLLPKALLNHGGRSGKGGAAGGDSVPGSPTRVRAVKSVSPTRASASQRLVRCVQWSRC